MGYLQRKGVLDSIDESVDDSDSFEGEQKSKNDPIKKSLSLLKKKIQNFGGRTNISNALCELYFDSKLVKLFDQDNRYIVFKNCIFDTKFWSFIEPSPDLYLSSRIENDFIEWNLVPDEKKRNVLDFWEKIFTDENVRKYCMKSISRFLTGNNHFKQFLFFTGIGHNGKSTWSLLMERVFKGMFIKLPKTVVLDCAIKPGSTNPEIFRLRNARLAIIDEITTNNVLDPGQIKGLSGNDNLCCRDLYQRSKDMVDVKPFFFPIIITNENPLIRRPDTATWERIRLIEFESVFTSDPEDYIKRHPNVDPTRIFKVDPNVNSNIVDDCEYFLSYFMKIILEYESYSHFNKEEKVPEKVIHGLEEFKQKQNVIKQFMDENYTINEESNEIFTYNKLMREYNASKPLVTLTLEDLETALYNHFRKKPTVVLLNGKVKGLSKISF